MNLLEKVSLHCRLRKTNEARSCFIEKLKQRDLMKKKCKNVPMAGISYFEQSFILVCAISEWVSFSAFASLVGIPVGTARF